MAECVFQFFCERTVHVFSLEMAVQKSVEKEIKHAACLHFSAVGFNSTDDIIRSKGTEFDVNFSYDSYPRFSLYVMRVILDLK